LPGGDFAIDALPALIEAIVAQHPKLERAEIVRLVRAYGTRAQDILGKAQHPDDLGRDFGGGLREAEVRHLMDNEWAQTAADVVWRRSKCGLHMNAEQIARLDDWMAGVRTPVHKL
jgi:glycerol-3-phosphate dehydrogenase